MFQKLKHKWQIESNTQLAVILIVFAITGSSAAWLTRKIFVVWLNEHIQHGLLMLIIKFVIVTCIYPFILIFIGTLFGQHQFFKNTLIRWGRNILGKKS